MGTLSHFPTLNSLSARKFFSSAPLPLPNSHLHHQQNWYSKISVASSKKPRATRKAKSDADLRNDIRKFLSAVGLPENHVPSTKELSQNGRQDLAKIVRRRGYKFIRQLLDASDATNSDISCVDTDQTGKLAALSGSEGQNENLEVLANDVSPSEAIQEKDFYHDIEKDEELKLNDPSCPAPESTSLSMQEKVAKFIERGELDTIEDIHLEIGCTNEAEQNSESKHACEAEYASSHPEQKDLSFSRSIAAETLNENAPLSMSKNKHPLCENIASSGTVEFEEFCWSSYISALEETSSEKGLDIKTQKTENQAEIKHLKFLLHQKELELTQLKQQIEKEKLSLSVLQTKAETAISNAQNIISEKETELHAAEESLSGLKEVEIQYSGDGEIVELAGSFNGWHHRTKMDLEPSSSIMTATGSRTSRLWRAVLWLYPGVYEIKFIVDGHWRIDPQRESISRDSFHNNILRVD